MVDEPEFLYYCEIHGGHNGGKVGRTPTAKCVECIREKTRGPRKPKSTTEAPELCYVGPERLEVEEAAPIPAPFEMQILETPLLAGSDFEPYPGLFERLCEMAHDEVRTPAQQIIHYLRTMLGFQVGASRGITMPTIEDLRSDLRAVLRRCELIAPEFAVNYQADEIMKMLDAKYFSLAQMEVEVEGILGPKRKGGKIE